MNFSVHGVRSSVWADWIQLGFYMLTYLLTSAEGQMGRNISVESDFHFLGGVEITSDADVAAP